MRCAKPSLGTKGLPGSAELRDQHKAPREPDALVAATVAYFTELAKGRPRLKVALDASAAKRAPMKPPQRRSVHEAASLAPCIALLGEAPVTLRLRALVEQAAQVETRCLSKVSADRGASTSVVTSTRHPRGAARRSFGSTPNMPTPSGRLASSDDRNGGTLLVKDVPYGPLRLRKVLQGAAGAAGTGIRSATQRRRGCRAAAADSDK